jgi:predicted kinase
MSKLIIMAGIPGSGKSTYAKEHKGENDIYISRDEVRFSLLEENDDYFSKETQVYNKFIETINRALQIGKFDAIWVDATHINKKSRTKLLRRINQPYSSLEAVWLKTPLQTCLNRNNQRTGITKVPDPQIRRMNDGMEEPLFIEGFDKITIVELDKENTYTKEDKGVLF